MSNFDRSIEQSVANKLGTAHIEILKQAVEESDKGITTRQVGNSLGLSCRTPPIYLKQLVEKGLLLTSPRGPYFAPANLRDKLLASEDLFS